MGIMVFKCLTKIQRIVASKQYGIYQNGTINNENPTFCKDTDVNEYRHFAYFLASLPLQTFDS